jgi:hypothetical protein
VEQEAYARLQQKEQELGILKRQAQVELEEARRAVIDKDHELKRLRGEASLNLARAQGLAEKTEAIEAEK